MWRLAVPGAGGPVLNWRDARYVDWGTLLLLAIGIASLVYFVARRNPYRTALAA